MLGDNGAGKSTFIKILVGRAPATTRASSWSTARTTHFSSPARGQGARHRHRLPGPGDGPADVGLAELLPRLGADEGPGPFRRIDSSRPRRRCARRCGRWASTCATPTSPSARCRAASASRWRSPARCTSAPRSSSSTSRPRRWASSSPGVVLRYVAQARDRGLGVIFITHNPHHAYPVGDRFVLLNRGQLLGDWRRARSRATS